MKSASEKNQDLSSKTARKDLVRVIAVGFFFVAAALFLNSSYIREQLFDFNRVRSEIHNNGWEGVLAFGLIAAAVNALGIPRIWVCAMAGSLFGAIDGGLIGLAATILGSVINFIMGRSLLRGPIRRRMPKRLRKWYKALDRHGFRAILYLRLFPLTNATLTNLLGGASFMKFRDYLAATTIGYLPFTIAFATLGSSAAKQNTWQLVGGLLLFAAVALGQWMWDRSRKNPAEPTDELTSTLDPAIESRL